VELTAIPSPKPVAVTAANDWTKEMATKGFPELKKHYAMLGAGDHTHLHNRIEFGHNYNLRSRQMMYGWFNRHLGLGIEGPEQEREFVRLTRENATVWTDEHPKPEGGEGFERKLLRWWHEDAQKKIAGDREVMRSGVEAILGRTMAEVGDVEFEHIGEKADRGDYWQIAGLIKNTTHHEELPAVFLYPKEWGGKVVIVADRDGKAFLFGEGGEIAPPVAQALSQGAAVCGVDLLYQGEFLGDGETFEAARLVENGREAAGYTHGYNHSVFAKRVHDLLTVIKFIRDHERKPESISLVAGRGVGVECVAALTQSGNAVDRAMLRTDRFRFGDVSDLRSPSFLPGGAKYGDVPGLLSLVAPRKLWLLGEDDATNEMLKDIYARANVPENLMTEQPSDMGEVLDWLVSK
jgi:hypothetical protein